MIDPARVEVKWDGPDFPEPVRHDVRTETWYTPNAGGITQVDGPPPDSHTHPPEAVPQPRRWDSVAPYVVGFGSLLILAALIVYAEVAR